MDGKADLTKCGGTLDVMTLGNHSPSPYLAGVSLKARPPQASSLAGCDLVVDSIIARLPHLGLEVQINQFPLLRGPLSVCVPVVDHFVASSITDLDRGVGQCAFGAPFNIVAGRLANEERFGAALVAVAIEALLDSVVHNFARSHLAC